VLGVLAAAGLLVVRTDIRPPHIHHIREKSETPAIERSREDGSLILIDKRGHSIFRSHGLPVRKRLPVPARPRILPMMAAISLKIA